MRFFRVANHVHTICARRYLEIFDESVDVTTLLLRSYFVAVQNLRLALKPFTASWYIKQYDDLTEGLQVALAATGASDPTSMNLKSRKFEGPPASLRARC